MNSLAVKLRIGEKIGIGFGLICLIFLTVIWQYNSTLRTALADYRALQEIYETKKSHALAIENGILDARRLEKEFLIHRDRSFAQAVDERIMRIQQRTGSLRKVDPAGAETADRIDRLTEAYHRHFRAVVEAWNKKGLDHNSGLQGAFRNAVHELETIAGQLNVGRSYLKLLQIRRSEKDLGLRREAQYRTKVLTLIDELESDVTSSQLEDETRRNLLSEIAIYRTAFEDYSDVALANEDIRGGKGLFRQAAHRIEDMLNRHYVPDLESRILQLRRREKDYLLRNDKAYVDMVLGELDHIHAQVNDSAVSATHKERFQSLLQNYQRDFLALVRHNDQIDELIGEMGEAVSEITLLAEENADNADQTMNRAATDINHGSLDRARLMLWIVAAATILGALFAIFITLRISRPLRSMAALLDKLAYEEPATRMAFLPGGRDEVNAMAESVNTMADHKSRFIDWWKSSMREREACRNLDSILSSSRSQAPDMSDGLKETIEELSRANDDKYTLQLANHRKVDALNDEVIRKSDELLVLEPEGKVWLAAGAIQHAAKSIRSIVKMMDT